MDIHSNDHRAELAGPAKPARGIRTFTIAAAAAVVLFGGAAAMAGTAFADVGGDTGGSTTPSTSSAAVAAPSASDGGSVDPAAPAPPAHTPHLDGDVSSVDSTTILITDHDGFTRTIHLSGSTVYGDGISLPITVGEHIHAEGSVDTDGTSLAATQISVAPEPPAPGAAGPGAAGPGALPAPPAPPTDGSAPTPPTDGSAPTPPALPTN